MINYINHFSLIIFYYLVWKGFELLGVSGSGVIVRQALIFLSGKDITIIICQNKLPDRKWGWSELSRWLTSYPDGMILRIWGFWKKTSVEVRPLKLAVESFWIWDQISLGFNRQKWVEILDTTSGAVCGGYQFSMVSIGFYDSCLYPQVTKN